MTYLRIHATYVGRLGVEVGLFVAVDHLRRAGRLDAAQEGSFLDLDDWFEVHLPNPPFYADGNSVGAVTWFKASATDLVAKTQSLTAILDAHGVAWETSRSDDPGTIVYEDDWQVGVVPRVRRAPDPAPEGLGPTGPGSKRQWARFEQNRTAQVPLMTQMPPPGPPQPPTPQHQPQQPPAQQPMGWVNLTLQGSMMTSSMITPSVKINGYPVPSHYGENVIPVYAGPTRVDVSCQWLKEYGQATLETVVPAGQSVTAFYAAPFHQFARGNIGLERQKRPGLGAFIAIITLVVVVVLAIAVLPNL